jgi:3-oxo-5-alpha-steroid 4-dehydrogenase 1
MTPALFHTLVLAWTGVAAVVFFTLFFITAPYGRHGGRLKRTLPGPLGWFLMEAPSPIIMAICFALGTHQADVTSWVFLGLWELHYIHRAFIFPFRMRGAPKPMPLAIALSAIGFNMVNALMNGKQLFTYAAPYTTAWLSDPRFIAGIVLFVVGFATNLHSDTLLLNLRAPGESGYKIPRGGLFRYVSCPNYFGELLEWTGFAVATWSLPALTFALWSAANLAPRAVSHHRWYREKFADYPPERKALIPFVV